MNKHVKTSSFVNAGLLILELLLLVGNVYLVKSLVVFGSPLLFAVGLAVELILLVVFAYSFVKLLQTPILVAVSILRSAWKGALSNTFVKQFYRSHTRLSDRLAARLNLKRPSGLYLTIGLLTASWLAGIFSSVLQNVLSHGSLTQTDTRIMNLMPTIRTPLQTSFFRFVTFTDNSLLVLLLVLLASGILWRRRQRLAALFFVVALVLEESISSILKQLVGRARPDRALSLYDQSSFSFPSGHVMRATVLSGLLAFLLYRSYRSAVARFLIVIGYVVGVALVALSRVYLGVHYPSDVLAGVLLGGALLVVLITTIEIACRYQLWGQSVKTFRAKQLLVIPPIVVLSSLSLSPIFVHFSVISRTPKYTTIASLSETTVKQLPLYSETLSGKTMEPINFIYLGSAAQIEHQFLTHGWYKADRSTVANTLQALAVGFQGRQYLMAPVTPSYLAAEPETVAYQQPTKLNTLRQRHHTRLWRTNFKLADGSEIWLATASYDEGIEFSGTAKVPTHHIDPNVDAERSYIADSLDLKKLSYLQVVKPQAGRNAGGDSFFTDGRAIVSDLTAQK